MKDILEQYLNKKRLAWAESTFRVESTILRALLPNIDGNPDRLWEVLQNHKPYTRSVTWGRVTKFWSWTYPNRPNPYQVFRDENRRLFKNCYARKHVAATYEEVRGKLERIEDKDVREHALDMLRNGLRFAESLTIKDEAIQGKGGKIRKVFLPFSLKFRGSYYQFWTELKKVGIRPHDLRKLAATKFVELGMREADLLKVMGWNSMQTAQFYLQPKRDEELREIMVKAANG
jgi:hypothetical protein